MFLSMFAYFVYYSPSPTLLHDTTFSIFVPLPYLLFFFSFSLQIIITAMDRFVWFVLLVVFSHLVTEFTRVTGYSRGQRHDAVMVNDVSK